MHPIWNGIRKEISQKSWPGRWQETKAALYFMPVLIRIDNIYGVFVIVLIAFLAILHDDVPTQAIVKDLSSQAEHLFEQINVLFGVMRLNNDDHNYLLVLGSTVTYSVPSTTSVVHDIRSEFQVRQAFRVFADLLQSVDIWRERSKSVNRGKHQWRLSHGELPPNFGGLRCGFPPAVRRTNAVRVGV